jgi:glycosyltransferase involved in cell wall biosynthesis
VRILLPIHQTAAGGGIGRIAAGLARALPAALPDTDQLVVYGTARAAGEERQGRPRDGAVRFLREQAILPRVAREVDLVHLCDARPLLASRTPFLITVHDVTHLDAPAWYSRSAVRYKRAMLAASLAKHPAAIVCVSGYTRDRLLAHYPRLAPGVVRVIHPGLEAPAEAVGRPGDAPYFLTVSTIEARKNHLTLLEAFRRARARGLAASWKVVGAPRHGAEPIMAALRAEPGVEVLGRVRDRELERLYRGALFTATPSHIEGFGFPPLEGMLRGVPAVCSEGSAFDETVGDAARRVAATDVEGWTAALLELAADAGARAHLARVGAERARRFTWEAAAEAFSRCYHEI